MHFRLLEHRGLQGAGTLQDEPLDAAAGHFSATKIFDL